MNGALCVVLASLALAAGCVATSATTPKPLDPVRVLIPAILEPSALIDEAVRRECALEMTVAVQVFDRVKGRFPTAVQVRSLQGGTVPEVALTIVKMEVVTRHASGNVLNQQIAVRIDLLQGSKVVSTAVFERTVHDLVLAPRSACNLVQRTASNLGRDIATWIAEWRETADQRPSR